MLVVVVRALSVVVKSSSFLRFGTCQMLGILKLTFSAFYVVGQLDCMGIADVPRYVTHTVPSAAAVPESAVAACYVCPTRLVPECGSADAACCVAGLACYFVGARIKMSGPVPRAVRQSCGYVKFWV